MKVNSVSNQNFGLRLRKTPAFDEVLSVWKKHFYDVTIARSLKKIRKAGSMDDEVRFVRTFDRYRDTEPWVNNLGNNTVEVAIIPKKGRPIKKNIPYLDYFKPEDSKKLKEEYAFPGQIVEDIISLSETPFNKKASIWGKVKSIFVK